MKPSPDLTTSEGRIEHIIERLTEAQERLRSGRSSVTAQAMILSTWTEKWPVDTAIAVARFLNGQDEMRPRVP